MKRITVSKYGEYRQLHNDLGHLIIRWHGIKELRPFADSRRESEIREKIEAMELEYPGISNGPNTTKNSRVKS